MLEIGTAVNVFGLTVAQGELIHADRHGALVIPNDVIPRLKTAIDTVVSNEAIVLEPARQNESIEQLVGSFNVELVFAFCCQSFRQVRSI